MNMKNTAVILLAVTAMASCQEGHPAKFTVQVKDNTGKPLPEYLVQIGTFSKWEPGQGFGKDIWEGERKSTGTDGRAIFEYRSRTGEFGVNMSPGLPDGYYDTTIPNHRFQRVENGRWMPDNPLIEVVLKRKLNPIPMYARKVGSGAKVEVPDLGREFGFDLLVSDWVAPHGKGKVADFVFRLEQRYVSITDFDAALTVRFSNKGDGLIRFPVPSQYGSELKSDHCAPQDGYIPDVSLYMSSKPLAGGQTRAKNPDMNYYFRIRTVLDKDGNVKSALYGKIDGDIRFDHTEDRQIFFTYYLNPTPNDRNVEYDPERNLFAPKDTRRYRWPSEYQVTRP